MHAWYCRVEKYTMFCITKWRKGKFVEDLNEFNTLKKQLASIGDQWSLNDQCITPLISMLDSWENLVVATSGSCRDGPKIETIVG
jgi:hypothetical protein